MSKQQTTKVGNYYNHRIEIKPNKAMQQYLISCFGYARFCWNRMLKERITRQNAKDGRSTSLKDIAKDITRMKNDWEFINPAYIQSMAYNNLSAAYNRFFNKTSGAPRMKHKGKAKDSFTCYAQNFVKEFLWHNEHGTSFFMIKMGRECPIPKDKRYIKMTEDVNFDPTLGDQIVSVTIQREIDRYFATFCIALGRPRVMTKATEIVGLDLGLKNLIVTSDGEVMNYPKKRLNQLENRAKFYQRRMSKKFKKGLKPEAQSRNYQKAKIKHQKVLRKQNYIRKDAQNQIAARLVANYAKIFVEDMTAAKTRKNKKLAVAIGKAAWGNLIRTIKMTARQHGATVTEIKPGRAVAPTQTCSCCGHRFHGKDKLSLSGRTYACPECGLELNRDLNAAIVIKQYGERMLAGIQPSE